MSVAVVSDQRFSLDESTARRLVSEHGTPLYVIGEDHLRRRIRRFVSAWPGDVSFASKANTTLAVLKIAHSEGCSIDAASEGELRGALRAGIPAKDCRLHGNNKSLEELSFAIEVGVGKIIVDAYEEIERLRGFSSVPPLLLRLSPGVDPKTNAKISTGQADSKFGFPLCEALQALKLCLDAGLPVIGWHCHVGSQLMTSESQTGAAVALSNVVKEARQQLGFVTKHLNIGGGLGVRYTALDEPVEVGQYCDEILAVLKSALGDDLPELGMEPGRALIAESCVTVYTVGVVKVAASGRTFVAVDGGLSDNPRPALYGSKYDLVWFPAGEHTKTVTVSGKHCETDMLFADVEAPVGVKAGDLVQVLCTGAYNASMASNYNGLRRPASVLLRNDGSTVLVQRREAWDEVHQRDLVPEGL